MSDDDRRPRAGFNLSRWALEHPALTRYLMVVLMVLGFAAYFQLGQDEDPPFTFRAMVVRTYWPGATAQQVAEQVTDKIERTLQEVPYADMIRSYSKPGESQIIFQIKDSSQAGRGGQRLVHGAQEDRRHALHAAAGVQGPFFNDEFGDVYGVIYALEADAASATPSSRPSPTTCASSCCACPTWPRSSCSACRTRSSTSRSRRSAWRSWGWTSTRCWRSWASRTRWNRAGAVQTPLDVVQVRVAGQFEAVEQLRAMPIRGASGNQLRLGDIAEIKRGYVDPPQVKVRHQGKEVIALGVSMAKGGDIIRAGQGAASAATGRIDDGLPAGIKLVQVQDQPKAVATSVNEFVQRADRGGGDRAGGELHRAGPAQAARRRRAAAVEALVRRHAPGPGGGHHHPAGAGRDLPGDELLGHRPAQDLAGLADHRAGPAGGRRHHRGGDDGAQDGGGLRQGPRRHLRLRGHRHADAHRHADHRGRLPADRHGQVDRRANTPSRSSR